MTVVEEIFDAVIKELDARIEASHIYIDDLMKSPTDIENMMGTLNELQLLVGINEARRWLLDQKDTILYDR